MENTEENGINFHQGEEIICELSLEVGQLDKVEDIPGCVTKINHDHVGLDVRGLALFAGWQ